MSLTIGRYGATGTNSILSQGIKRIEDEQESVAWQTANGTISPSLAGLGDKRDIALKLSPKMDAIKGYQANISSVQNRLSVSANSLKQLTDLAQNLNKMLIQMQTISDTGSGSAHGTAVTARSGLDILKQALNATDGVGYIFSGANERAKTIPSTESLADSKLAKTIADYVNNLTDDNVSEVIAAATKAAADNSSDLTVFNQSISVSAKEASSLRKSVIIGDNAQSTTTGVVATEGDQASDDTTTGSPIRDLMRDMMIVASLSDKTLASPGVSKLVNKLQRSVKDTANKLVNLETTNGAHQNDLKAQQGTLQSVGTMLTTYMGDTIQPDMGALSIKTNDLKVQLEASFLLINKMKNLTLANYI
ncbi:flagellar biosynthesis protein FlgL (plasmid) [Aristophania vespae]|uniref:Flagellar biosynthesis protein FlgL n=1 Tax=Aristophania vespae TaxID=2697033 RepID=A0A6P1NCY3_9PROT|nr:flagellar biosynthesis protein FlgL [Aristophania vespae]QHI96515.1 flagellar biosynthesis protein FlgL [Aristophania vespae]